MSDHATGCSYFDSFDAECTCQPSTRTTCARCSWPLEIDGLSDEDADRVEALHRQRCPGPGLAKQLESYGIRTPAGDITVRAEPTLEPGEWRLGHITDRTPGVRLSSPGSVLEPATSIASELPAPKFSSLEESYDSMRADIGQHIPALELRDGDCLYYGNIKITTGPLVTETPPAKRELGAEGKVDDAFVGEPPPSCAPLDNTPHFPMTVEHALRRPDGFTQTDVDAAKAVLLRKVERKR